MKKYISLLCIALFSLFSAVSAFAQGSYSSPAGTSLFALGGIEIGDDWSLVTSRYGTPDYTQMLTPKDIKKKADPLNTYSYGKTVFIETSPEPVQFVRSISVTANNGWKTPRGIGVGSTVPQLLNTYGNPTNTSTLDGNKVYSYGQVFSDRFIGFTTKNDVITGIYLTSHKDYAHVHLSQKSLAIGNVHIGNTMAYVKSIYGEPTNKTTKSNITPYHTTRITDTYYYGDTVSITAHHSNRDGEDYISSIETTANNGWKTFQGIAVGMDASILKKVYGKNVNTWKRDGATYYQYRGDPLIYLVFKVKNNKIVSIYLTGDE